MLIQLADALTIDAASVRETSAGYLLANARAARTGVQTYRASELGLTDRDPNEVVRVLRPASEVFKADSMATFAAKPLTNDHPRQAVTAQNWRDHAIGFAGGDVVRDGDFIRVPLMMTDAAAIADFKSGKRELSAGYSCQLDMTAGITDSGEAYDAVQSDIKVNHVALCDSARGGAKLTFGDQSPQEPTHVTTQIITVDSIPLTVDAVTAAAIQRLVGERQTALDAVRAAETAAGELRAAVATKDGEIAALTSRLADATNPANLAEAAAARAALITRAKTLLGDAFTGDAMSDADIKRAAVAKKLPAYADPTQAADAMVDGAFGALTSGVTVSASDGIQDALRGNLQPNGDDARTLRDKARATRANDKANAYLGA